MSKIHPDEMFLCARKLGIIGNSFTPDKVKA
jgi:hypothetical protein